MVTRVLETDWSPEQISGWLKLRSHDGKAMRVSHETIYKSLFIQARGVLREELKKHLRSKRMFRRAKSHRSRPRGQIVDVISIRERPAEIEDRAIPGHWEGDLIIGSDNSAIATVVERHSRFTVLCRVDDNQVKLAQLQHEAIEPLLKNARLVLLNSAKPEAGRTPETQKKVDEAAALLA